MTSHCLDLALPGGVQARVLFTGRGRTASDGSSRSPYARANLASHVGDDPDAVLANRTSLAGELGVPAAGMTFMHPDHGRGVAFVHQATGVQSGAELHAVDALVTDQKGVGLVALAADCVPIILVEPAAGVIAAVHCGWRGLVLDVVGAAVSEMVTRGSRTELIQAFIGPAICGSCYPVPEERAEQVAKVSPAALCTARDGQPALDLRAGLVGRFDEVGTASSLIGGCTAEDSDLYSYRRDGRTGRQAGAVAIVAAA